MNREGAHREGMERKGVNSKGVNREGMYREDVKSGIGEARRGPLPKGRKWGHQIYRRGFTDKPENLTPIRFRDTHR